MMFPFVPPHRQTLARLIYQIVLSCLMGYLVFLVKAGWLVLGLVVVVMLYTRSIMQGKIERTIERERRQAMFDKIQLLSLVESAISQSKAIKQQQSGTPPNPPPIGEYWN